MSESSARRRHGEGESNDEPGGMEPTTRRLRVASKCEKTVEIPMISYVGVQTTALDGTQTSPVTFSRALAQQMNQAAGAADRERLNQKKEELRRMVRVESEFSAVAKDCLVKSNIGWVRALAAG
jgi:hypothetical protein